MHKIILNLRKIVKNSLSKNILILRISNVIGYDIEKKKIIDVKNNDRGC